MEKVKRNEGRITAWVGVILVLLWCIIWGIMSFTLGFDMSIGGIWVLGLIVLIGMMIDTIKTDQHIRTLELIIYEYEKWDEDDMKYKKVFIVESKALRANFFMHKHTSNYEVLKTDEEIRSNIDNGYYVSHKTEEEAMGEIYKIIRGLIKYEKEMKQLKIRNVKSVNTFTVIELKEKLNKVD